MGFKFNLQRSNNINKQDSQKQVNQTNEGDISFIIYETPQQQQAHDIAIDENKRQQIGDKTIEEQVLEEYQNQIDQLDVRQTLKSQLRRMLDTIVSSYDSDKFLLEIRKQLKQSQKSKSKSQYSGFLKLIDKLYLLAVDKCFFLVKKIQEEEEEEEEEDDQEYEDDEENPISTERRLQESIFRLHQRVIWGENTTSDIISAFRTNEFQRLAQNFNRLIERNSNRRYEPQQDEQQRQNNPSRQIRGNRLSHPFLFSIRNASSQVSANEGDTTLQTSSETISQSSLTPTNN